MTALFSNKPFNNFISLCLLLCCAYIAWACADDGEYDYYDSNFTPETFITDKATYPFLFSYLFYYDIYNDVKHNKRFNAQNVSEWQGYLGNTDPKILDFWLNKAKAKEVETLALLTQNKGGSLSGDAQKYATSLLQSKDNKTLNFTQYLSCAKRCEFFAVTPANFWDYNPKNLTYRATENKFLLDEMLKAFDAATDAFIKQRYAFQITRFYYYIEPAKATAFFEKHRANLEKNAFFYRILTYAAGAYAKQGNYSQANYYYSLAFAATDALKTVAHWSFHPQEESDWQKTLALCKNNREKATLWQMLGIFYADETRSIQEIHKIDPKSKQIDLLLTRLVNKIERSNVYEEFPELDGNPDEPYDEQKYLEKEKKRAELSRQKRQKQLNAELKWITPIADQANTANPFLWSVSAGYLQFLAGNITQAKAYYQKAEKQAPNTNLAKKQLRLLQLIAHTADLQKIETQHENQLLADLKWLYDQQYSDSVDKFRCYQAQYDVQRTLAQKYAAQKDAVKSECWVTDTKFYTSTDNIKQFKAFLGKTNPTPYEHFCIDISEKQLSDIWEFEAIQAAFAEKLDDAIAYIKNAKEAAQIELLGNPFNGKIKDCHNCDHEAPQKTKYTKLSFLEKMREMKQKIERNEDIYNNALLLGNAYYNITHYGNARYFYESKILGNVHYSPFSLEPDFKKQLTDNALAQKYYKLALQNATDKEQQAKCHYLIAKCERNEWYNENKFKDEKQYYSYDENGQNIDFITWNGFKALQKLSDTKYYQEVLKECGYFAHIVEK
jgi:hypothetical protein